jgi:hypothetical protein
MNDLNLKLQGRGKPNGDLFSFVNSDNIEAMDVRNEKLQCYTFSDIKESKVSEKQHVKYANKMTDLLEEFQRRISNIQTYSEANRNFSSHSALMLMGLLKNSKCN